MQWPIPPYVQLSDFLPEQQRRWLLQWALDNRRRFKPAEVWKTGEDPRSIRPETRIASVLRDLGELERPLCEQLRGALPNILELIRAKHVESATLELELVAHKDGAHFKPHIDIPVGPGRKPVGARPGEDRLLSAVYYFYAEPKRFSGGELRLYRFGVEANEETAPEDYVDVQPLQNTLVAFPTWARHEVRPVRCPSGKFQDSRFALNCWYCGHLKRE